jgi:hypothetical protein
MIKSVSTRCRSDDLDEQLETVSVGQVEAFVDALKDRFLL